MSRQLILIRVAKRSYSEGLTALCAAPILFLTISIQPAKAEVQTTPATDSARFTQHNRSAVQMRGQELEQQELEQKNSDEEAQTTFPDETNLISPERELSESEVDALYNHAFKNIEEPEGKAELLELQDKYHRHIAGPSFYFDLSARVGTVLNSTGQTLCNGIAFSFGGQLNKTVAIYGTSSFTLTPQVSTTDTQYLNYFAMEFMTEYKPSRNFYLAGGGGILMCQLATSSSNQDRQAAQAAAIFTGRMGFYLFNDPNYQSFNLQLGASISLLGTSYFSAVPSFEIGAGFF